MKIKIIFLLLMSSLTIQCSSDDNTNDSGSDMDNFLLGNWTVKEMTIQGNITANGYDSEYWGWVFKHYPIPITSKIDLQNYSVNFSNYPNLVSSKGNITAAYSANDLYYGSDYSISRDIENIDFFKEGNWSFKSDPSDIITIIKNSQNEDYGIAKISENEFIVVKQLKDDVLIDDLEEEIQCIANLSVMFRFKKL